MQDKFAAAVKAGGIHIVRPDWVNASVIIHHIRLPESEYAVFQVASDRHTLSPALGATLLKPDEETQLPLLDIPDDDETKLEPESRDSIARAADATGREGGCFR